MALLVEALFVVLASILLRLYKTGFLNVSLWSSEGSSHCLDCVG